MNNLTDEGIVGRKAQRGRELVAFIGPSGTALSQSFERKFPAEADNAHEVLGKVFKPQGKIKLFTPG